MRETLNAFDKDMTVISKYTRDFFESIFTEKGIDLELALEKFVEVHTTRIKREEAILFMQNAVMQFQTSQATWLLFEATVMFECKSDLLAEAG